MNLDHFGPEYGGYRIFSQAFLLEHGPAMEFATGAPKVGV